MPVEVLGRVLGGEALVREPKPAIDGERRGPDSRRGEFGVEQGGDVALARAIDAAHGDERGASGRDSAPALEQGGESQGQIRWPLGEARGHESRNVRSGPRVPCDPPGPLERPQMDRAAPQNRSPRPLRPAVAVSRQPNPANRPCNLDSARPVRLS